MNENLNPENSNLSNDELDVEKKLHRQLKIYNIIIRIFILFQISERKQ